jgi:hypothetical protein
MPGQPGGLAARPRPNAVLQRHVEALEKTTAERFKAAPTRGKLINLHTDHSYLRAIFEVSGRYVEAQGKRLRQKVAAAPHRSVDDYKSVFLGCIISEARRGIRCADTPSSLDA